MAISFNYTTLVAALQSWPEDSGDTYVADIPNLIGLGETRLLVDLNLELFDLEKADIVVTGNNRLVPKPEGLLVTRTLGLIRNGRYIPLTLRSRDWCDNFAPDPTALAVPRYFYEYSETHWKIVGTPIENMLAKALYMQRPAGLTEGNPTTWLGTNAGDLLLACCLMEAEHWLKADDRYADMKTKYYQELLPVRRLELQTMIRTGQYTPYVPAAQKAG